LLKPIKANTISGDQPSKVAVLGETQESVDSLFSCKAVTELTQSSCLEIFHLTDLHWYNNFDMMLRVKVAASAKIVEKDHVSFMKALFKVVDHLASSKYAVPADVQDKLAEKREKRLKK